MREYRARFFDGTTEISGDWSPVEGWWFWGEGGEIGYWSPDPIPDPVPLGSRAFRDTRPVADRGKPEVREYRARFFDGTTEISGEWSPVEGVTVSG